MASERVITWRDKDEIEALGLTLEQLGIDDPRSSLEVLKVTEEMIAEAKAISLISSEKIRRPRKNTFIGVTRVERGNSIRYRATYKGSYIGSYSTPREAAIAHDAFASLRDGINAVTNKSLGLL